MKFIHYLESITGVGIYPLLSFIVFFLFFLLVSAYAIKADKEHIRKISQLPLN